MSRYVHIRSYIVIVLLHAVMYKVLQTFFSSCFVTSSWYLGSFMAGREGHMLLEGQKTLIDVHEL